MNDIDYLRDYAVLDGERLESLWGEIDRLRAENHHLRKSVSGRPSSELHEAALAEKDTEIERLRAERDTFYMDYRIKCDEETKRQLDEIERLRAKVEALKEQQKDDAKNANSHLHAGIRSLRIAVSNREAELTSAKALLREAMKSAFYDAYVLNPENRDLLNRIRAALGDSE